MARGGAHIFCVIRLFSWTFCSDPPPHHHSLRQKSGGGRPTAGGRTAYTSPADSMSPRSAQNPTPTPRFRRHTPSTKNEYIAQLQCSLLSPVGSNSQRALRSSAGTATPRGMYTLAEAIAMAFRGRWIPSKMLLRIPGPSSQERGCHTEEGGGLGPIQGETQLCRVDIHGCHFCHGWNLEPTTLPFCRIRTGLCTIWNRSTRQLFRP